MKQDIKISKPRRGVILYHLKSAVCQDHFPKSIYRLFLLLKERELFGNNWKTELHKYIAGIIKAKDQKPIIVNGMHDYIHAFVGLCPAMAITDIIRVIKNNSSNFINDHKFVNGKFRWQKGYGAFSYSHSHIRKVYEYVLNQENITKRRLSKKHILVLKNV